MFDKYQYFLNICTYMAPYTNQAANLPIVLVMNTCIHTMCH